MMPKTLCMLLMVLLLLQCSHELPTYFANRNSDYGGIEIQKRSFYVEYLEKYGYLELMGTKGSMRVNQTEITDALKTFQKMAGIPITGVFDAVTNDTMYLPRCGVQDIVKHESPTRVKRYTVSDRKWKMQKLYYKLTKSSKAFSSDVAELEIEKAFKMWSEYIPITFTKTDDEFFNIELYFASYDHLDGSPFDGPGQVLAHAFYPQNGDIHFDDSEYWTINGTYGQNLLSTTVHEIGHALGLKHSAEKQAIMYPFAHPYDPDLALHADDVGGIQAIYGNASSNTSIDLPSHDFNDFCNNATFDAITKTHDGTVIAFKGNYYYQNGVGNPRPIQDWKNMSGPIDAALTMQHGITYLFKGNFIWEFHNQLYLNGPTSISSVFHRAPGHIDAAFFGSNYNEIYFIKGDQMYVFSSNSLQPGYPRPMAVSAGLSSKIDATLTLKFTYPTAWKTYFFSGNNYYRWDISNSFQLRFEKKGDIGNDFVEFWFGCPNKNEASNYTSEEEGGPQALNADFYENEIFGSVAITTSNMNMLFLMLWCGQATIHLFK